MSGCASLDDHKIMFGRFNYNFRNEAVVGLYSVLDSERNEETTPRAFF